MILRRQHHFARSGFTLLEVLIAVAIFAIVIAAINAVFYAALRLRNTTTEQIEQSAPVERTLEIMKSDYMNMAPLGGALAGEMQTANVTLAEGQVGAQFPTMTGRVSEYHPWSEVQRVSYHLAPSTNRLDGFDLLRVTSRNLLAEFQQDLTAQYLMGGVASMDVFYYDGTQWTETWDSTTADPKMPRAVRVQIRMMKDELQASVRQTAVPVELVIPIAVQSMAEEEEEEEEGES